MNLQLPLPVDPNHPMITVAAVSAVGQDVNDDDDSEDMTSLMYASLHDHSDTARVIIEKDTRLETVLNLLDLLTQKYEY